MDPTVEELLEQIRILGQRLDELETEGVMPDEAARTQHQALLLQSIDASQSGVEAYQWMDTSQYEQANNYTAHLQALLDEQRTGYHAVQAHQVEDLLNVPQFIYKNEGALRQKYQVFPMTITGTTDLLIQSVAGSPSLPHTRVVCHVKKDTRSDYETLIARSTAELLTAEWHRQENPEPTFALLTNLGDDWTFMWLAERDDGTGLQRSFCQLRFGLDVGTRVLINILRGSISNASTGKNLFEALGCIKLTTYHPPILVGTEVAAVGETTEDQP